MKVESSKRDDQPTAAWGLDSSAPHQSKTVRERVEAVLAGLVGRAAQSWAALQGWPADRGAALGILLGGVGLACMFLYFQITVPQPNGFALLVTLAYFLLAGCAGFLAAWLGKHLLRFPAKALGALGGAAIITRLLVHRLSDAGWFTVLAALVVPFVLIGSGAAGFWFSHRSGERIVTRLSSILLVSGLSLIVFEAAWLAWAGPPGAPVPNAAAQSASPFPSLPLPDPAQPGLYPVRTLAYGSGTDRLRPEYGRTARLTTQPVDGSAFIRGWDGLDGWVRTRYWGFDAHHLPLNGRVWYPQGEGAFPLVLIVHGNHAMEDFSEGGYAYLGELLASRGAIVVSVDQNFLNSSTANALNGKKGGLSEENDARGWLLLEHLRQWRAWQTDPGSPFYQKVDLERVALIGHSRGGEAVAVAAVFNKLPYFPDNAAIQFDYGFGIRSVIALAPVDGQYEPGDRPAELQDINYLVLQGSHDGDVQSFAGSRQFERAYFSGGPERVKASIFIQGANHSQFNTAWGRADLALPRGWLLNKRPLLSPEQQQRIAQVFISAFLEITLHDQPGYLPLFRDHRSGDSWLPGTIYIQRLETSWDRYIATFEEDLDLTTSTLTGGQINSQNLNAWWEGVVWNKWDAKDTHAAYLRWSSQASSAPTYTLTLPTAEIHLSPQDSLVFSLADAYKNPGGDVGQHPEQPIDLTIEVTDRSGQVSQLPLSWFAPLQPRLSAQVMKVHFFSAAPDSQVVFQSYQFPLQSFVDQNPQLDLSQVGSIRWVFDRSPAGVVILDSIGFRKPE